MPVRVISLLALFAGVVNGEHHATVLNGISDELLGLSATGGTLFAMELIRTYKGPRIDFDTTAASLPFLQPADEEICERWAVLASTLEPTDTVSQLAELGGWCVVVVVDKNGE